MQKPWIDYESEASDLSDYEPVRGRRYVLARQEVQPVQGRVRVGGPVRQEPEAVGGGAAALLHEGQVQQQPEARQIEAAGGGTAAVLREGPVQQQPEARQIEAAGGGPVQQLPTLVCIY